MITTVERDLVTASRSDWTLAVTLRTAAERHPQRVCVRTMGGAQLTYGEVFVLAQARAAGLADLGVRAGDRVVLIMDNSIDMLIAWFAINMVGAVEVPCNTANRGTSLSHVMNNSGAGVAIIDSQYAEGLADVAAELTDLRTVVVRGPLTPLPWTTLGIEKLTGNGDALASANVSHREPASIIYTSGTTGPAKGVVVPHAHMHAFAAHVVDQLGIDEDDVYYVCLPLFHANAQFMQVLPCLMTGAEIVLADAFSASGWIRDLNSSGATVTSLLGVMAQYVFNRPPSELDTSHKVTRMITIPLPAAIAEDFERRFATTGVEAYGMTEICLPLYRPRGEPLRPGSCGKVLKDWFEVAIVDPETDEVLPDGAVGEIVVRPRVPYTTFLQYHEMPERTVEATRNLWFHTGDAGRRDADGYFYFMDRLNDRIRRKGENVTAYDIEVALSELPEVIEAAVVAKPAAEGEDDIKAYLVVADDSTPDPVEILSHCVRRLPYFAVPRYLEFIHELPKTPTGKVLKRQLRAGDPSTSEWDRERAGYTVKRGVQHLVQLRVPTPH